MLVVISTTVPAGTTDDSQATRYLQGVRDLANRTAMVVEQSQVGYIAERYRRPPEAIRAIVRAADRAAARHDLPSTLLLAIVETESSFDSDAQSRYGARGPMQIVPRHHPIAVAAAGGAARLHDADVALETGASILAGYYQRTGNLAHALKRYSGGATSYSDKVLARKKVLDKVAINATRQLDTPAPMKVASDSPARKGSRADRQPG